jgi:DNA-directed RNA polymerase specialized sigma24 family protein
MVCRKGIGGCMKNIESAYKEIKKGVLSRYTDVGEYNVIGKEDLVHDAFLKFLTTYKDRLDQFESEGNVKASVLMFLKFLKLKATSSKVGTKRYSEYKLKDYYEPDFHSEMVHYNTCTSFDVKEVVDRTKYLKHVVEGYNGEEIARIYNLHPKAVTRTIQKERQQLKLFINDNQHALHTVRTEQAIVGNKPEQPRVQIENKGYYWEIGKRITP